MCHSDEGSEGGKRASNFTNKRLDKESEDGEKRIKAKWDMHHVFYISCTFIVDSNIAHIIPEKYSLNLNYRTTPKAAHHINI